MKRVRAKPSPEHRSKKVSARASPRSPERDRFAAVRPRLAALLRKHFTKEGRAERIARAEEAWRVIRQVGSAFKQLDRETWKWIAQSKEFEDV